MSAPSGGQGGVGYDISASISEATTQGFTSGGPFTVGGHAGSQWLPLALVALAALGLVLFFKKRKK